MMDAISLSPEAEAFCESLIGLPYLPGSDGPDSVDCYGLLFLIDQHLGPGQLPQIVRPRDRQLAAHEIARVMASAPERRRWRQVPFAAVWDVAMMGNVDGREHHVGKCMRIKGQFGVLHADGDPGVVFDDLPTLQLKGFNRLAFYRPIIGDEPPYRTRDPRA